jgi:hypothetical protein
MSDDKMMTPLGSLGTGKALRPDENLRVYMVLYEGFFATSSISFVRMSDTRISGLSLVARS